MKLDRSINLLRRKLDEARTEALDARTNIDLIASLTIVDEQFMHEIEQELGGINASIEDYESAIEVLENVAARIPVMDDEAAEDFLKALAWRPK